MAFDVSLEAESVREEYGQNGFGQGCLSARRLLENDVRFVEVNLGGWDTHGNNFTAVPQRAATLDQALSAPLSDLSRRGMQVVEGKVGVPDFNATIAYAPGLPTDLVVHSRSGRPFTVAHKGQPALEMFG